MSFPSVLTAKKTETIEVDTAVIKQELDTIEKKLDQIQKYSSDGLTAVVAALNQIKGEFDELKRTQPKVYEQKDKFKFYLEKDENFFADKSFEHIINEGQKIQAEYWHSAEERLGARWGSPSGEGWLGTTVSPLIKIICNEPEYHFANTLRLPSRFQLTSHARFASVLYFEMNGDKKLIDNNRWGMQTNDPVCIYVEPSTVVNGAVMRNFEQGISNVIIVALNKGLPIYLGADQDRFWIQDVNIQQHQGSLVGIKNGPVLDADWYPVEQKISGNVSLPDPRFLNIQMEGPFSNKRPQAAMMLTGLNGIISNLDLHGWMQGPVIFSDNNWILNGITADEGLTHDKRLFCDPREILTHCVSQVGEKRNSYVAPTAGGLDGWYLKKRSLAPRTAGFYTKGQVII